MSHGLSALVRGAESRVDGSGVRVLSEESGIGTPMGSAVVLAKGDAADGCPYDGGAQIDDGRDAGDKNGARKECVDEFRGKPSATGIIFAAALCL